MAQSVVCNVFMPAYLGVATDVMHIQSEQVPEAMWHEDSAQVSLHHLINLVVQVTVEN